MDHIKCGKCGKEMSNHITLNSYARRPMKLLKLCSLLFFVSYCYCSEDALESTVVSASELASTALKTTGLSENRYILKVLKNDLSNKKKKCSGCFKCLENKDHVRLRSKILEATKASREKAVTHLLKIQSDSAFPEATKETATVETAAKATDFSSLKDLNEWIVNTLLKESLSNLESLSNNKYWKIFYGALSVVLPIGVGIAEYWIVLNYSCGCDSSSSSSGSNSTL